METTIKFAKVKPNAIIPSKREEDAGLDLYACFDDIEEKYITINPHETRLIPTGIACACDKEYCLVIKERGSTGSKGIAVRCGIIDSNFRGEIFVALNNTTDKPLFLLGSEFKNKEYIQPNVFTYDCIKAIAQALVIPVPKVNVEEITFDELQLIESNRGEGCLGSSGK